MAAFDYFLKIDGITGESTDSKHKGEIEVLSWSWGESHPAPPGGGGGGGAGKVEMTDFHVSANFTKASPQLLLACASGKHFKNAVLAGRRGGAKGQGDFLTFSLTDVLVSSFQTGGTTAEAPLDSVSLNFAKIEVTYKEQTAKGGAGTPVRVGWDRKSNKAF
jgi:type VI secretion system secreted protein Hcp